MSLSKARIRDWTVLFLYVAIIYATLPLTPKISKFFTSFLGRNFNLAIDLFIIILVAVLPFVLYKRLNRKGFLGWIAIIAAIFLYAIMLSKWTKIPAEKIHLVEYGLLSYLLVRVFGYVRSRFMMYALVILSVAAIGYVDELIQLVLPNRVYDVKDIALNAISGILGLLMVEILS